MKVILTEEQQNKLKLAPFIYKAIISKNTSLGDNPAFPNYGDFGYEYDLIKTKFEGVNEIIDNFIANGSLETKDPDYLLSVLSKKIEECKKIEKTIAPQLEKLCENIVNSYFSIPEDTVILKCKLVGKIKPKNSIRILPEGNNGENEYSFEDANEVDLTNKVILKRRFINSLIQGFSYWLSTDLDDWYDTVKRLNENIWGLWYDIIYITDYLLFVKKEEISEKTPNQLSYVEVHLGKKGKKSLIEAQGLIFPYLLRESIRGFFELFSSHGLPEDNEKAMYIIRKSDFLVAEPWDLRFGMGLIDIFNKNITKKFKTELLSKTNKIPFFFSELCSTPTDEFNDLIKNILLGTRKGEIILKQMDSEISHDFDYQAFKDRISQKNINTTLISDDCFSKNELNDYVLQENETDEMMAYHGSGANFDKFNHKKYLNTGAGSQTFGWGTYVTNDEAVAKGYSDNAKIINGDTKKQIMDYLTMKCGYDSENANRKEMNKRWMDVVAHLLTSVSYLYEVDIPEDNGQNYLEWYGYFPPHFMKRVLEGFLRIHDKYLNAIAKRDYPFRVDLYQDILWMKENPERANDMINIICRNDDYEDFFSSSYYTNKPSNEGKNIYGRLRSIFGSDKAASLFLMQCGFDGIKYPAGTRWQKPDGASEDAYNYVIFDANKVKITNKTEI